jgi:hypothetical protein
LLATARECHRALAAMVERVWIAQNILASSTEGPALAITETAQGVRLDLRAGVETDHEPDARDSTVVFQVSLEAMAEGYRVASVIEAHLGDDMGEYGPGHHILYDTSTDLRRLDAALNELRSQVAALEPLENVTDRLGW